MNQLVIPSSPNWYETDIMACAPDNTVMYGSRQDLVVIKPTSEAEPDDVQIITKAHAVRIISVNINRNWGAPHKYAVTVSEDKIIKLWDLETLEKKMSHSKHVSLDNKSKVIGAVFAGDDRVVSASETGQIVIWNIVKNENFALNGLFTNKTTLTCLSVCPHATWLAAFGLKSGLIVVVDLRKTGKVIYTLRGHAKAVVSLAWCPAPVNIFPSKPHNRVVDKMTEEEMAKLNEESLNQTQEESKESVPVNDEEVNSPPDEKIERRKQSNPKKEAHPWTECYKAENSEKPTENTEEAPENDFLKECEALKTQILNLKISEESGEQETEKDCDNKNQESLCGDNTRKILKPKTKKKEFSVSDILVKKEQSLESADSAKPKESCSDDSKLDNSVSSEGSRHFSSASSCDNELNCSKRTKEMLNLVEPTEGGEVFHEHENDKKEENWRTEEPVGVDEQPRKEFLLASSARESNIYIWRAGTDGRMQTFITVPTSKNPKFQKKNLTSDKVWISLCWVAPNTLLSSSRNAELLQWTLPKPMLQAKFLRTIHRDHWSVLFSIKAPIVYLNECNFLQKRDLNAWTTGMERTVINTDLSSMKSLACYPTFGGSVNCLVGSPLDPNRLAIGTGEGIVNIWDLSRPHKKIIAFSTFYQKILSAITALAWHPVNESSLAWGTTEGRVGLLDVASKGKTPKILPHYFKSQVFKLEWGPTNGDMDKQKLFVISESKVAIFDPTSNDKDPEVLELPDNTLVYTMAWKPDCSLLLVSSKTGTLISYSSDLKITNISYVSQKLQSIVWHPDAASDDINEFKYCKMFASIVKYTEIIVFDLSIQNENNDSKIIAHFKNRDCKISSMTWSPHSGNHLVVADESGVAQVFDIESKSIISTYISPSLDPLLSIHWSPLDPDCVIVGTISHKLIVWKISEHPMLTEKDITALRNKITKAQQKEVSDLLSKEKEEPELETVKNKVQKKSQLVPLFYSMKEKALVLDMQKLLQWKLGNKNVETVIGDGKPQLDVLDIFGDQGHMEKVLEVNMLAFKQQGKHQKGNLLALFQGDISTVIKEAIEQKRVNPWIISMSPMVSPKLWQTACETYVQQLIEEPEADPMEVVTYLLACHKVEEAVDFLLEQQLFREALVLAKARLGGDNSMVTNILDNWAKNNVFQGNFELAACCYITLGKFDDAASVLFRRSTVELLEMAHELAKLSDNLELQKAVAFRLNAFKMEHDKAKVLENTGNGEAKTNGLVNGKECFVESLQKDLEELNNGKEVFLSEE